MSKQFSIFLFSLVMVLVLFSACDNPFSDNLGSKVDVEPPTINIVSPASGDYIKGTAQFTGQAKAYRELRRVEYRILANDEKSGKNSDWTAQGIELQGSKTEKNWSFTLDTLGLSGGADGFLKMQFRVTDTSSTIESAELLYIIKNQPPVVKVTAPNMTADPPERGFPLMTGGEIRGQITDRRGLKPGYPMIKLWPESLGAEPADDDPDWGYVSMFLGGYDSAENGAGTYADRGKMPVVRADSFSFKLDKYTIDRETDPNAPQAQYVLDGGNHIALDYAQSYFFRIKSSDTYTDENSIPRNPAPGEAEETVGFFPDVTDAVTYTE